MLHAAGERRRLVDTTMFWAPESGGVRRYVLAKHAELVGHPRWDHRIVTPARDPESVRVRALPLPFSNGYRVPVSRREAADVIARLAPDVIEAGDPYLLAWSALDAGERTGAPVVAFCHSDLATLGARTFGEWARAPLQRYLRSLYERCALVLAPSRTVAGRLTAMGCRRVAVQPLGVDTETFSPARASSAWREAQSIAPDERVLLYAGRFGPEKNLQTLADAVDRLGAPYRLVLVGGGPSRPRGTRTIVLPFERDTRALARAIASADAFVHAGDQETFGLAALEALACGTPVVARCAGGLAEIVDDRVGMSVHAGTADAFAEAIEALFRRDRAALAEAGRARAAGHDWSVVVSGLVAHYERLLPSKSARSRERSGDLAAA